MDAEIWAREVRRDEVRGWLCCGPGCEESATVQVSVPTDALGNTRPVMACDGHAADLVTGAP